MKPIIIIEGSRNVGKSFLIDSIKHHFGLYKVPFKPWFDYVHEGNMNNNGDKSLFYMPLGGEITTLDLYAKGILNKNLILDRFFLSNVVYGIQSGRIEKDEAYKNARYILDNYSDVIKIIHIEADPKEDDRNKDGWNIYDQGTSNDLYSSVYKDLNIQPIRFKNTFDKQSVLDFYNLIYGIYKEF